MNSRWANYVWVVAGYFLSGQACIFGNGDLVWLGLLPASYPISFKKLPLQGPSRPTSLGPLSCIGRSTEHGGHRDYTHGCGRTSGCSPGQVEGHQQEVERTEWVMQERDICWGGRQACLTRKWSQTSYFPHRYPGQLPQQGRGQLLVGSSVESKEQTEVNNMGACFRQESSVLKHEMGPFGASTVLLGQFAWFALGIVCRDCPKRLHGPDIHGRCECAGNGLMAHLGNTHGRQTGSEGFTKDKLLCKDL